MLEVLCAILESIPYFRAKNLFFLTIFFSKEGINIPAHICMYLIILVKWFYILLFKKKIGIQKISFSKSFKIANIWLK